MERDSDREEESDGKRKENWWRKKYGDGDGD